MNLTNDKNCKSNNWFGRQGLLRWLGVAVAIFLFAIHFLITTYFALFNPWGITKVYACMNAVTALMLAVSMVVNRLRHGQDYRLSAPSVASMFLVLAVIAYGIFMPRFRPGLIPAIYIGGSMIAYLVAIPVSFLKWNNGGAH